MSISTKDVQNLAAGGGDVLSSSGDKIGAIGQLYLDDATGEPSWVTAKTGLFGTSESFVPLSDASSSGDDVRVNFDKEKVKNAPQVEADGAITPEEEEELYRYYDVDSQETNTPRDRNDRDGLDIPDSGRGPRGKGEKGHDDDATITRSEEELRVGTKKQQTGKARLRKYVVTENVTLTVPVEREVVRLEREPVGSGDSTANTGADLDGDDDVEITLSEEVPVVQKKRVAKERVRLAKDTVTEEVEVSEDIKKEQIDTNVDEGRGRDAH